MTTMQGTSRAGAPWHFWVVAVVSLLWNSFGGYDYTMSHLSGDAYYRQMGMTEGQITAMVAYPSWMHAVWAVGVWGSVLGSILLLCAAGGPFTPLRCRRSERSGPSPTPWRRRGWRR